MAQKTDAQLTTDADVIKNEVTANANTASRVGSHLVDNIDSKINIDKIVDEDNMASDSATLVPTQQSVKAYSDLRVLKVNSATALSDGATIDLTAIKHTLATSSSRTFTISYTGDDITIEVTLSATSATQTFPAGSLCVSEGIASGDNTCAMAGVSGDKYIIAIKKMESVYYVVCKNFGQ